MPTHRADEIKPVHSGYKGQNKISEPKLSPHERFPTELLVELFILTANNEVVSFPPNFSHTPWVLSRVCRRWRNIALNESRLWGKIKIWPVEENLASRMVALANHILPLNGPLSISASKENSMVDLDPNLSNSLMGELIIPNLLRIRELHIRLSSSAYTQLFAVPAESFVSIETLDIVSEFNDPKTVEVSKSTVIFSKAHQLRDLRVAGSIGRLSVMLTHNLLDVSIPWHQLVFLDFRPSPLVSKQIHFILRQSPALQTFTATMNESPEEDDPDDIILPHLHSLTLWLGKGRVLRPLILPALKILHFDGLITTSAYPEITHMISRSRCSLDVFEGCGRSQSDTPAMNELMSHMSTVHIFTADTLWIEDSTLRMIGLGELLPRITRFVCGVDTTHGFVDALETRLQKAKEPGSMVTSIQAAVGQCPRMRMVTESEMADSISRLDELNEQHGTEYTFEWIIPSRE